MAAIYTYIRSSGSIVLCVWNSAVAACVCGLSSSLYYVG